MESQCSLRSPVATYCNAVVIMIYKYMGYLFHQQSEDSTSNTSRRLIRFWRHLLGCVLITVGGTTTGAPDEPWKKLGGWYCTWAGGAYWATCEPSWALIHASTSFILALMPGPEVIWILVPFFRKYVAPIGLSDHSVEIACEWAAVAKALKGNERVANAIPRTLRVFMMLSFEISQS